MSDGLPRVLVVDDERPILRFLSATLGGTYKISEASTGEDAIRAVTTDRPDMIILDLGLPDIDGVEVTRRLREWTDTPIIVISVREREDDKIAALDAGADDYLVKPFAFSELLARVRALLRRGRSDSGDRLRLADLELDSAGRVALRGGKEMSLTAREFDLLEYLLRHSGTVVSREMLARDVWQETQRYTPLDNVIDVHVAHLRKKLDEPFKRKLLHTVRGVGFVLREEPS